MSALNQMGIPIASLPGEGFELVEGFYVPPLMFTKEEAIALLLGLRLLTQQAACSLIRTAESSLAKIKVVLSEQVRMRSEALTNIIEFITPTQKFDLDDPQLLIIQKAIQEKRDVYSMSCRVYATPDGMKSSPSVSMLEQAIRRILDQCIW